jgi:putative ABC transport system substrate-binding protein
MPVIGFLHSGFEKHFGVQLDGFHKGLKEGGFVEGQSLTVEYRWAEGHDERLPAMAVDLVRRKVAAIVAAGGGVSTLAAKAATRTIPIVFATGSDPVRLGFVESLARPGGNLTGTSFFSADLVGKEVGLLNQIAPDVRAVGLLHNPKVPDSANQPSEGRNAAQRLGLEFVTAEASTDAGIEQAFAMLAGRGVGALVIGSDPFFGSMIGRIAELTQRHRMAAVYGRREFAEAGGLMSYGTSITDSYRQVGVYTTRILKGDKPQDLPVTLSAKFQFTINLKTAKTLGLTIPSGVLSIADEVIE